jgi:hypothetical protein
VSQFKPSPCCPRCREQDWAAFGADRKRRLGLQIYCKPCSRTANAASYRKKSDARKAARISAAPDDASKWNYVLKDNGCAEWRGHNGLAYEGNLSSDQAMKFSEASDCGFGAHEIMKNAGCFGFGHGWAETHAKIECYRECR